MSDRRAGSPRHRVAVVTAAVVLVLAAVLTALAWQTDRHNEQDLLQRQVAQAAAVLTTQVAVLQTRLADAGQVVDATNGTPAPFRRFAGADATPGVSYSLWRVTGGAVQRLAVQGPDPELPASGTAFLAGVRPTGKLTVAGVLPGGDRLGYALMPAGETNGLVIYVESPLAAHRRITVPSDSAFGGLDFAVYLGAATRPDQLVEATRPTPIPGGTASTRVPFGDTVLTVVGASPTPLTGRLSALLPWLVLGVGVLLAVGGAVVVDTTVRRRAVAERLARATEELYQQQRGIAADLQRALLPAVPVVAGLEIAARYRAGVDDLEVGGDWYDVVEQRPGFVVFVVGDVSGRGLPAATTMAALRFAVRAFLSEGRPVDGVLHRLRALLDVTVDHQFATVLLGELDVAGGRLRLLSAGHFPPLLLDDGPPRTLELPIGRPVGVDAPGHEEPVTVDLAPGATLLAFSDGLVERRGEDLDAGLARLAAAAGGTGRPLEETADRLLAELTDPGGTDDTVLLCLRWTGRGAATGSPPATDAVPAGRPTAARRDPVGS